MQPRRKIQLEEITLNLAALVVATMATLGDENINGIALTINTIVLTIVTRASIKMQQNAAW